MRTTLKKANRLARYLCPFCRGLPIFENTVTEAVIRCKNCGVTMKAKHHPIGDAHGIELVHAKWNARD